MTTGTQPAASSSERSSAPASGPSSSLPYERPNTPVPDELAQVRAEITRLEVRESELRGLLMTHPELRTGADWLAQIKTVQTTYTDMKELRANHPKIVEQYEFSRPITRVVLSGITEDGEVVSGRRQRRLLKGE